ncbi:MAG: glycosyltransferase family 1 protein [Candidatus Promineifilaceae bacterium]|nr:glycosyltransferase family 1 protein [Candidatus Promineifilaceae bacterium]
MTAAVTQGGGIGRYTRELVRALAVQSDEFRYHLFSAKAAPQMPVSDSLPNGPHITYREAPLSHRWLYRLWYRLKIPAPVQLLTGAIDLFHSPDFVLPPVAGSIPTLLTVHDLSFVHYPSTFTPALIRFLEEVVPRSIKRATHVLADSQATKRDLTDIWSVTAEKVTVLHSGVSDQFRPVVEAEKLDAVRRHYGIGPVPYLFSISTIQPRKNYQMLIRAFRPVSQQTPHSLIIAGGEGWLADQVYAEVEAQDLEERVRFIGFARDEDLPALYSGADGLVFPSLYEGFGIPLLEAMACGTPVLAADASSLPEVAGDAAMLRAADRQDLWTTAMIKLIEDEGLRKRLVEAGFRRAAHFSWSRAATQLRSIYRDLLASD